jgi:hypothetical protein
MIAFSGCSSGSSSEPTASAPALVCPTWVAEYIGRRGVLDNRQTTMSFDSPVGCVASAAATAIAEITGEAIRFGPLATLAWHVCRRSAIGSSGFSQRSSQSAVAASRWKSSLCSMTRAARQWYRSADRQSHRLRREPPALRAQSDRQQYGRIQQQPEYHWRNAACVLATRLLAVLHLPSPFSRWRRDAPGAEDLIIGRTGATSYDPASQEPKT